MADDLADQIKRAQEGDLDAFSGLVRRFQDMAVGYAFSILGDFHAAEDAAQEAFLQAFQSLRDLREPAAFPGWFRRVVFKHCDRSARKPRPIPVPDAERLARFETAASPDESLERQELRDQVLAAVESLPEHERIVATLFYIRDHSHGEIADFAGIPVATVKSRLHSARRRLREKLESVMREGFAVDRPSRDSRFEERIMQLAHSAYFGDVPRARRLLDDQPQLANAEFSWFWYWRWSGPGWTPLHRAAEQGHAELCELLLDRGANVNARHAETGWTPLHMVFGHRAGEAQRALAERLIERGARLDAFAAAAIGDIERRSDLDLASRGLEGATPLHFSGTTGALEWLLESGFDPSARCEHNAATPLRWMLAHGRDRALVERLLAAGCDWDVADAVALGDVERARQRLDADPDALFWREGPRGLLMRPGTTLLHLAANRGHVAVSAELLARGIEADALDASGTAPLYGAAFNAHAEVVRLLIEHGADVERVDPEVGGTPLYWALWVSAMPWQDRQGLLETLRQLVAAGASATAPNRRGLTPLGLLESRGQHELLDFLQDLTHPS